MTIRVAVLSGSEAGGPGGLWTSQDFEESRLPQSSQSGTWRLEVDLSSSSFGSDLVCAKVEAKEKCLQQY